MPQSKQQSFWQINSMRRAFSDRQITNKTIMKKTKTIMQVAKRTFFLIAVAVAIESPTQAQLGGLIKKSLGGGGEQAGGGAEIGKMEEDLFSRVTPAADLLHESIQLYKEVLGLKIKDNTEAVKDKSKGAVVMAKFSACREGGKELEKAAKNLDKINMSPEQQEKYKQAHAKFREGFVAFVAVSVPVALAIKEITEKDPKALLFNKDLVLLGVACVRDLKTFADVGIASSRIGKAKIKEFPDDANNFKADTN